MADLPDSAKTRSGLAVKLAAWLAAASAVAFLVLGYLVLQLEQRHFEQRVLANAEEVGELVWRGTRDHMLRDDREALTQLIRDIAAVPGVTRLRLLDRSGKAGPPATITTAGGQRYVDIRRPVENHPDCYNASCHVHAADERVLGVIAARLSLAEADAQYAALRGKVIWLSVGVALSLCVTGFIFIWKFVHRPVGELAAGMRRVAAGDLEHRIEVRGADEVGALAESFNRMTEDLASARQESAEWAGSLERRVAEKSAELEKTHAAMAASEKMAALGKMSAMVAHEVNSPLFAMLTYARLAQKKLAGSELSLEIRSELSEHLDLIERESKRCGNITKDLLELVRKGPTRGHLAEPNCLNSLARKAIGVVRHQMEQQSISLKTEFHDALPDVLCDPGEIQQVLLALLTNAGDAMPSGGGLYLGTGHDPEHQTCTVHVRDSGPGIREEDLSQIFDLFFTTKQDQHRTGLGLAIAKSIVERHGGSIQVASVDGHGAEFVVSLPAGTNGTAFGGEQC